MRRPERGGMFLLAHVTDPHFRGFAGAEPGGLHRTSGRSAR